MKLAIDLDEDTMTARVGLVGPRGSGRETVEGALAEVIAVVLPRGMTVVSMRTRVTLVDGGSEVVEVLCELERPVG